MAYSAVDEQQLIGPIQIWGKTYALPGADPDWNSVSGFTELFEIDPELDVDINLAEEFMKRVSAAHLAATGEDQVSQDLTVSLTVKVKNLYSVARALGLLDLPSRTRLPTIRHGCSLRSEDTGRPTIRT